MQQKLTTHYLRDRAKQAIETIEQNYMERFFIDENRKPGLAGLKKCLDDPNSTDAKIVRRFYKEYKEQAKHTSWRGVTASVFCREIALFVYDIHALFINKHDELEKKWKDFKDNPSCYPIQEFAWIHGTSLAVRHYLYHIYYKVVQEQFYDEGLSDNTDFRNFIIKRDGNMHLRKSDHLDYANFLRIFKEVFDDACKKVDRTLVQEILKDSAVKDCLAYERGADEYFKNKLNHSDGMDIHDAIAGSLILHGKPECRGFLLETLDKKIADARKSCTEIALKNIKTYLSALEPKLTWLVKQEQNKDNPPELSILFRDFINSRHMKLTFPHVFAFFGVKNNDNPGGLIEDVGNVIKKQLVALFENSP